MLSDEIERLRQLRDAGTLSNDEFARAKERVLNAMPTGQWFAPGGGSADGRICGCPPATWLMLMHFSQLLAFAAGAGVAVPIIMWALSKDDSPAASRHGLMIINWFLSTLLYGLVIGLLCLTVIGLMIGVPMAIALGVALIVFPIVGGIKASRGEFWSYPLTIRFFEAGL